MFCLIIFMCFISVLCPATGKEDKESETEVSRELCKSNLNLQVLAIGDCSRLSVPVSFTILHPDYRNCCRSFIINLSRDEEIDSFEVEYNHTKDSASHTFENLTLGVYELYIDTVYTYPTCPRMRLRHPLINMSSEFCTSQKNQTDDTPEKRNEHTEKTTVIIISVTSFILLLIIIGLIYLAGRMKPGHGRIPDIADDINQDSDRDKSAASNIKVYIFHYYDRNKKIKKKVQILKDFLLKSSYFSSVEGIEDELAAILFDVNLWLNDVLDEKEKDGTIRKIILITSLAEDEPHENDEIENVIFTTFIKKLNNNIERCLTGYDNLFVVQLDGSLTHSEKFKNIVRRDRYSLAGESVQDHMVDLCLNLCSGLKLDMCNVEDRIKELLLKHPVKSLENSEDFVECV